MASASATWMMPIYCTAGIAGPNTYSSNMRIPIDNEALMFYRLRWRYTPIPAEHIAEYKSGEYYYPGLIPGTWKTKDNVFNDYNVNRVAQRNFSYTGMKTFPLQDIAMMENQWGPIAEREREHLTSMDYMIVRFGAACWLRPKRWRTASSPRRPGTGGVSLAQRVPAAAG